MQFFCHKVAFLTLWLHLWFPCHLVSQEAQIGAVGCFYFSLHGFSVFPCFFSFPDTSHDSQCSSLFSQNSLSSVALTLHKQCYTKVAAICLGLTHRICLESCTHRLSVLPRDLSILQEMSQENSKRPSLLSSVPMHDGHGSACLSLQPFGSGGWKEGHEFEASLGLHSKTLSQKQAYKNKTKYRNPKQNQTQLKYNYSLKKSEINAR